MHIEFVNAVLGGDFSAMDVSITALATYMNRTRDHSAGITDLVFHRRNWREHLHKSLEVKKPDWVGISTNTMYMGFCREVMLEVKKHNIPIILGGHHASTHPESTFNIPEVDAICIGDGEYALEAFFNGDKNAPGIWLKKENIRNAGGTFIENLDVLPVLDWDMWEDLDKYFYYLGMVYCVFSRGCPYRCSFCDTTAIAQAVEGNYFRLRNPKYAADELFAYWCRYEDYVRLAQVFDPVFTFNEKWVMDFCDEYRSLGAPLPFSVFSRIDNLNENIIEALASANCAILRVGIEAGDEHIRKDVYMKKITNERIREVFRLCRQKGIAFTAFYILGGPGETRATVNKTIKFARELDAERSAFFIYKPFTTKAAELVALYGGQIDQDRWSKADNITFKAVISTNDLKPRQVEMLQVKAYFFTFGRRLLRLIRKYKLKYFWWLLVYMLRGLRHGLDWRYLLIYYHIYQGPYVKE